MPTTYTHYRFGKDVYSQLSLSAQETIDRYRGLYDIGLHGPDLLFYYNALTKNPVNQAGSAIHQKPGREFFENAKSVLNVTTAQEPSMAYVYGVLCHFALDSNCHPYIEQMVRECGISHSAIEAELDRFFMEKDGHEPLSYKPTGHLIPCAFHARVISPFFPHVETNKILTCIRSMVFYCNCFVIPDQFRRRLIFMLLKWIGSQHRRDMFLSYEKIPECVPLCLRLEELYQHAIKDAAELIQNYEDYLAGNALLDKRFDHTFGET